MVSARADAALHSTSVSAAWSGDSSSGSSEWDGDSMILRDDSYSDDAVLASCRRLLDENDMIRDLKKLIQEAIYNITVVRGRCDINLIWSAIYDAGLAVDFVKVGGWPRESFGGKQVLSHARTSLTVANRRLMSEIQKASDYMLDDQFIQGARTEATLSCVQHSHPLRGPTASEASIGDCATDDGEGPALCLPDTCKETWSRCGLLVRRACELCTLHLRVADLHHMAAGQPDYEAASDFVSDALELLEDADPSNVEQVRAMATQIDMARVFLIKAEQKLPRPLPVATSCSSSAGG